MKRAPAANEVLPAWELPEVVEVAVADGGGEWAHEQGESYERRIAKPRQTHYFF